MSHYNYFTNLPPSCSQAEARISWIIAIVHKTGFNLFSTNVPLLYPLNTSENQRFPDVSRVYRSGTSVENGLTEMMP